jgi:hypothetical protein
LVHAGVLEPDSVKQRYAVMPDFARDPRNFTMKGKTKERSYSSATTWVREQQEAWRAENADREEVPEKIYYQYLMMAERLCESDLAMDLFNSGRAEVSVVWEERIPLGDGGTLTALCKARVDWLDVANQRFVDLKTCADVMDFEWSIRKYGYARQIAFYQRGLGSFFGSFEPYIIACESTEPYACRAARVHSAAVDEGFRRCNELLLRYAYYVHSDTWPGPDSPDCWQAPEVDKVALADWFETVAV